VTWGIENRKVTVRRGEKFGCHFDGHAASLLFFCLIHNVRELKTRFTVYLSRLLVLTELGGGYLAKLIEEVTS